MKKLKPSGIPALSVLLILALFCAESFAQNIHPPKPQVVKTKVHDSGAHSGVNQRYFTLARNKGEWNTLVKHHYNQSVVPGVPDFSKHSVIALFCGKGDFKDIKVEKVTITRKTVAINVKVTKQKGKIKTTPYILVKIPAVPLKKEVLFTLNGKLYRNASEVEEERLKKDKEEIKKAIRKYIEKRMREKAGIFVKLLNGKLEKTSLQVYNCRVEGTTNIILPKMKPIKKYNVFYSCKITIVFNDDKGKRYAVSQRDKGTISLYPVKTKEGIVFATKRPKPEPLDKYKRENLDEDKEIDKVVRIELKRRIAKFGNKIKDFKIHEVKVKTKKWVSTKTLVCTVYSRVSAVVEGKANHVEGTDMFVFRFQVKSDDPNQLRIILSKNLGFKHLKSH